MQSDPRDSHFTISRHGTLILRVASLTCHLVPGAWSSIHSLGMPPSCETLPESGWETVHLGPPSYEAITPAEFGLITEEFIIPSVTKLSFYDCARIRTLGHFRGPHFAFISPLWYRH